MAICADMTVSADSLVKKTALASILGITGRRILQLTEDGILSRLDGGLYELGPSVQAYIEFKTGGQAANKAMAAARITAETDLKTTKAAVAKLELAELEGRMHRAEDVAAMTEDLVYTMRGALIALPGRLAMDVAACSTSAEAADVIRREVYKVMRELARYRYDPAKYEERVRSRMDWSTMEDEA